MICFIFGIIVGSVGGLISPEDAEHAELFQCYCGRSLDVRPAIVCSGCGDVPGDCTCPEMEPVVE